MFCYYLVSVDFWKSDVEKCAVQEASVFCCFPVVD